MNFNTVVQEIFVTLLSLTKRGLQSSLYFAAIRPNCKGNKSLAANLHNMHVALPTCSSCKNIEVSAFAARKQEIEFIALEDF
jgi:hypothetical protein